ncbi:hypothetical protein Bca4012_065721 [Brassica carinata]
MMMKLRKWLRSPRLLVVCIQERNQWELNTFLVEQCTVEDLLAAYTNPHVLSEECTLKINQISDKSENPLLLKCRIHRGDQFFFTGGLIGSFSSLASLTLLFLEQSSDV